MLSYILHLDTALFLLINNNFHFSFLNDNMRAVTNLGNGWVVYWLALLYAYYYNRKKFKESFFLLFLTQIVPGVIDIAIKKTVHRPRPVIALHSLIKSGKVHVDILGRHLTENSFPSGHTVTVFSLAVALSYMFPKHKKIFYILAFVVGFSRVYDGEHYPLDVIAGGIIGYLFAKITLFLYKKIKNYKNYNFER